MNQSPPTSAPANLGQDLPSLAHLENSGVMRVLGGPPLEKGKRKDKVSPEGRHVNLNFLICTMRDSGPGFPIDE